MLAIYAATLVAFLVLDALWLRFVMRPIFSADVPHLLAAEPRYGVAAAFYALYCAGIVWFAVRPMTAGVSLGSVALNGAILGFLAYGAYEATNMATLKGWTWRILSVDLLWGTAVTALAAIAGHAARS